MGISIRRSLSAVTSCAAAFLTVLFLGDLAVPAFGGGDKNTPSRCSVTEQVIFSCQITGSKKVLSICASKSLTTPERYIQYRYGAPGSLELEFPAQRAKSVDQFKMAHYFRAQVDRRELTFARKDTQYTVYSYYEGEESPPQHQAGATVRKGSPVGYEKTFPCVAPYINHLQELDEVVACDANSPLSQGSCPP